MHTPTYSGAATTGAEHTTEPLAQLPPAGETSEPVVGQLDLGAPPPQVPQHAGPAPGAPRERGWTFWVPITLLVVVALAGLCIGAYLLGKGSRPSDQQIGWRIDRAVTAQRDDDRRVRAEALADQRADLRSQFRTRLRKEKKRAYDRGQAAGQEAGYASGQSAGYASGSAEGREEGLEEGFSEGYDTGSVDGFMEGYYWGDW